MTRLSTAWRECVITRQSLIATLDGGVLVFPLRNYNFCPSSHRPDMPYKYLSNVQDGTYILNKK